MKFKTAPGGFRLKEANEETGVFAGYASVFGGDPDSHGDVIAPGAYTDSIAEHGRKGTMPKLFWQHDRDQPIGRWTEMKEDNTGLWVVGKMNMGVQRAREALELLKEGDIDGLSIGYRIIEYSVDTESGVWTLEKLDLREVSVVSIGSNDAATIRDVKSEKIVEKLKGGDRLTEREFETLLKGSLSFSNSQAERAARVQLKGLGEPAKADNSGRDFLAAMKTN